MDEERFSTTPKRKCFLRTAAASRFSLRRRASQTPFSRRRFVLETSVRWGLFVLAFVLVAGVGAPLFGADDAEPEFLRTDASGTSGGRLVVALRSEPLTFNPVLATDINSFTVIRRLHADLVHIDRAAQTTGPALAREWTISEDGLTYGVELRRGLRFSDGHELDADDVVFSFQVYLDEAAASPKRSLLVIGGEPIAVRKTGRYSLELKLAEPYAVGDRLFDSLAILPEHRLREPYAAGKIAEVWGTGADPQEIVGLGPFRLAKYLPGERIVMERNPHYWKLDAAGDRLPYLDELIFLFVPDEDAQLLRFQAGETHLIDRLDAESFAALERDQARRGYRLEDLGAGLTFQFVFFNLNDLDAEALPEIARKQIWFRNPTFRRAVNAAIDRRSIIRLVYRGRATALASPVSAGNLLWKHPDLEPVEGSTARAREILRQGGFTWSEDGRLLDPDGTPVAVTLITNSSNDERVGMASIIEEDLRRLGMAVRAVPMEFRAMVARLTESYDYELCLLGVNSGDVDPNGLMNLMMSGGSNHLWRLGDVPPSTDWQKEIDELLREQIATVDVEERRRQYFRVQELFAEHVPLIPIVSPNVLVGAQGSVGNFQPAILEHSTLWNVEELFLRDPGN